MNADDVERILAQYGFELVSQKRSHRKWRKLPASLIHPTPFFREYGG
jgi:predicted RNA binding protein YcfA (HicA-like mRNA interferase family)